MPKPPASSETQSHRRGTRSDGTGRIYKRGNVWWIDFTYRGERHRESSGSTLKKDAKALLNKRKAEMGAGKLIGAREEKLRLTDAREAVEADYKMKGKKSLDRVLGSFGHLERILGDCALLSITPTRMKNYISKRQEEGAANSTNGKETAAIRRGLNLLHKEEKLSRVPEIPSPAVNNVREDFITRPELDRIMEHLAPHARPMALACFLTGWRSRSEVFPLKWSQVDWEAGVIRLEPGTTKNREGRTFPFRALPELEQLLKKRLEETRRLERERGTIIPWVFHRHGKPVKDIRTTWKTATEKAGLKDAWTHDLRRSAVRNMERAGVSRSVAMKLSGHKTEHVYTRYAIADAAALHEGAEKLAQLHDDDGDGRSVVPLEGARQG